MSHAIVSDDEGEGRRRLSSEAAGPLDFFRETSGDGKHDVFSVVMCGNQGVGKTALMQRFSTMEFDEASHRPTVAIDMVARRIEVDDEREQVGLGVREMPSGKRFSALIAMSGQVEAAGALLVLYDVSSRESFASVKKWFEKFEERKEEGGFADHANNGAAAMKKQKNQQKGQKDKPVRVVVATKTDLGAADRAVSQHEGEELAKKLGALFFETSAKAGVNVQTLFKTVAQSIPRSFRIRADREQEEAEQRGIASNDDEDDDRELEMIDKSIGGLLADKAPKDDDDDDDDAEPGAASGGDDSEEDDYEEEEEEDERAIMDDEQAAHDDDDLVDADSDDTGIHDSTSDESDDDNSSVQSRGFRFKQRRQFSKLSSLDGSTAKTGRGRIGGGDKYKLVFLGDEAVGKTALLARFVYGTFKLSYLTTIGVDFVSRTMHTDTRTVRLQMWDTAGQERFRSLIPSYIRDASVAIVVYDITDRASFLNTERWIADVRNEREDDVVVMLVGNKTDLVAKRVVTTREGEKHAAELQCLFIETSAKADINVSELFETLAKQLPDMSSRSRMKIASDIKIKAGPTADQLKEEDKCNKMCGCA